MLQLLLKVFDFTSKIDAHHKWLDLGNLGIPLSTDILDTSSWLRSIPQIHTADLPFSVKNLSK